MGTRKRSQTDAWPTVIRRHLSHGQHRNAYYLMGNSVLGAAVGVVFWMLFTRVAGLPPQDVGVGYVVVALGTLVGLVAKGGLDTAIVRNVPGADGRTAWRLLLVATAFGIAVATVLWAALAATAAVTGWNAQLGALAWAFVLVIGSLLVLTWIQDAYFLAHDDARRSFHRNVVFSAARLLLPVPIVLAAVSQPIAVAWAAGLAVSAAAAFYFARQYRRRDGDAVQTREFLATANRNLLGNAAEFLPGLILAPLVLAMAGPAPAAYFGIAWTAASILFLASAAISRSALADMTRRGRAAAPSIRRAATQHVLTILPACAALVLASPIVLRLFGAEYAANATTTLVVLSLSVLVVAPAYLYLAVLRARDRTVPLLVFPLAMMVALLALAPPMASAFGLTGVAVAWTAANAPFGVWATIRLNRLAKEVTPPGPAPVVRRTAYVE